MLKPKYVHGVNADEDSNSLLHRLQYQGSRNASPNDVGGGTADQMDDDGQLMWTWILG